MKYTFIVKITADTNNYRLRSDIKSELERSYPDAEILDSQITPTYGQNGFAPGKFKFHMEMKYACPTEEQAKKMCKYVSDFNNTVTVELAKPEKKDTPKDKAKVKESRGRFSSMKSKMESDKDVGTARSMRHESKELSEFINAIRELSMNESTYNRVMWYMDKYDTGTISAFHGHEAPNARVDNRSKSTELGKDLKALGYTYFMVGGSFMEMLDKEGNDIPENLQKNRKEWTYFVVDRNDTGKLKDDLVKLGSKYGQEAVLFSAKGSHRGQGISIANPSRTEDYGTLHHSSPNPYGDTRIRGRKYSYQ